MDRHPHRLLRCFALITWLVVLTCCAANVQPRPHVATSWKSTPAFSAIDYSHPEHYLTVHPSFGDRAAIERAAANARATLAGHDALAAATAWFDARVQRNSDHPYVWRPFEQVISDGYWMWCADRAVALGTLLRAMGVPTVWVKSMEFGWIREMASGKDITSYRGHVFLEVFLEGKWQLFDPVAMTVYAQYDPRVHLMPGDRYAYDKGDDPLEMVMSMQGETWAKQTRDYFYGFDNSLLSPEAWRGLAPPAEATHVGTTIYGVCHRTVCGWITAKALASGAHAGMMFGVDFEKYLPLAAGAVLVLTRLGDDSVLPPKFEPEYAPASREDISHRLQDSPSGHVERRLEDGTRVILVYGRDDSTLRSEIERLVF
jgi:hypothetical protein